MATYQKVILSGSTNGMGVKIASTSGSAPTTIHTAVSGSAAMDEIWMYAVNDSGSSCNMAFAFGGTTEIDNMINVAIPNNQGLQLAIPGLLLNNSLVVGAYAETPNVIVVYGFVNRIT